MVFWNLGSSVSSVEDTFLVELLPTIELLFGRTKSEDRALQKPRHLDEPLVQISPNFLR